MNKSYVYMLIDPRNNQPFYVGKGVGRRCYFHAWEAKSSNHHTFKLAKIRKIQAVGLTPIVKKVEENVSDQQAIEFECLLIAEFRDLGIQLTNLTDGGDGIAGYKHHPDTIAKMRHDWTDEQKKKISESLKGEKHPFFGKKCSEKRRQSIIAATTGVKKSTTEKMRKPKIKKQCPHCGVWASGGNLAKWHLDKCKDKYVLV